MKVLRSVSEGSSARQRRMRCEGVGRARGPLHAAQYAGARVLERDVEVGQYAAFGHQRDHAVDVGIGIDVVESNPDAELAECRCEPLEARLVRAPAKLARGMADVDAVGARVLRDHEQLLDPRLRQPLSLAHHVRDRATHEIAAHRGDDAERAAVIAAFGDLEIGVVARGQLDALRRKQVEERIVGRRKMRVHRADDRRVVLGPADREHVRMPREDLLRLRAQATRDDDLAVLGQRLADRVEGFFDGSGDEAAGVHDDEIGVRILRDRLVALGAQLGQDALGIDQGLRTAEAREADPRRAGRRRLHALRGSSRGGCGLSHGGPQGKACPARPQSSSLFLSEVHAAASLCDRIARRNERPPAGFERV